MRFIELTRGKQAIVDDEDFEFLSQWSWCAVFYGGWYAKHKFPDQKVATTMHRLLLGINDPSVEVDHRNRNGLDNRRNNLRVCTRTQNLQNRSGWPRTSRYKGVYWHTGAQQWVMQIRVNGRKITKTHADECAAAEHYDQLARQHFGEFAYLNFPPTALFT